MAVPTKKCCNPGTVIIHRQTRIVLLKPVLCLWISESID